MPFFVKTERFTNASIELSQAKRKSYLNQHKYWVQSLKKLGHNIYSGYLVNQQKEPGGGGLLIIEATNFEEAKLIIEKDPMIKNKLVTWQLQEWIPVA